MHLHIPAELYTEVPMSSQWNSAGYYYPTQIAQYGLSHYSKYIAERRRFETESSSSTPSTRVSAADDVARSSTTGARWRQASTVRETSVLRRVYDDAVQRNVYQFKTPRESHPRDVYYFSPI